MNKAILVGNLTKDPEHRSTSNGTAVTSFTVAVQRRYKTDSGPQADFINCVAWRSTAEFVAKYFTKGSKIGLTGSIQTRNYDDAEGVRKYVTEVVVDDVEFVTSKNKQHDTAPVSEAESQTADELFNEDMNDELPF